MSSFADKSRSQHKARAYHQLDDADPRAQLALKLKKIHAAVVIQAQYRSYVNLWRHYGPTAFVGRHADQVADHGKIFFPCVHTHIGSK